MPKITKPSDIADLESSGQPYSVCTQVGQHFHFSGIVAINADKQPAGTSEEQVHAVLKRMVFLLGVIGLTPKDVFQATVLFGGDMSLYDYFNQAWMEAFEGVEIMPARTAFAVARLPFGCAVEVAIVAVNQSA